MYVSETKYLISTDKILKEITVLECENSKVLSALAPLARIFIYFPHVLSVYTVVYSAIPQLIIGNCMMYFEI